MLQFQPLYVLWLKLQNTHKRFQCENVILSDILAKRKKKVKSEALCHDTLDALQKRCVSQVTWGRGGLCC